MIKSFGLLILRLSIGTMLIHHGYEKTADIENFADAFVRPLHLHQTTYELILQSFEFTLHHNFC